MFPHQCLFCDHVNPVGAKFCNDCGSPLHLKPCKQCEAINDHAAENCYQCGAADPALVIDSGDVESLTAESTAAPATPGPLCSDQGQTARVESMMHGGDPSSADLGDPTTSNCETDVQIAALEPRALSAGMGYPALERARTVHAGPLEEVRATIGPRPSLRVTPTEILPALLLIAVAISAFHVYRNPLQLKEWLDAAKLATASSRGQPTQSIPVTTNVHASPAPRADPGTGSVADATSDGPASTNTGSIAVPHAVREPVPTATALTDGGGEAATSNQSPSNTAALPLSPASASDRVTPTRLLGPEEGDLGTAGTATTSAAESRAKTTLAAGRHGSPKKTPTTGKTTPKKAKKASPKNPASTKTPAPNTTTEPSKTARRE